MYNPQMSDVDLFLRTPPNSSASNFLPWQSVYAEMVFMDVLWLDQKYYLMEGVEIYNDLRARFGKA
jgi:undecaprenyl diphosphate synthase